MDDRPDALVVGAGVVGVTTAYALARRGLSVTIVDRAAGPGEGASFANGAQLSYVYTDALASPALVAKLPMLLMARDPAFRLKASFDPDFIRWALSFLRNATTGAFARNTLDGLRLGLESRAAMHALLQKHRIEFGHEAPGKLHFHEDAGSFAAACQVVALKRRGGAVQEALTPGEAVAIEPALSDIAGRLAGAIYSPQEEVGDPHRFCRGLLDLLIRDYGVTARLGQAVNRIDLNGAAPVASLGDGTRLEARHLAVCTGVETPRLLRPTGIKVPIWPMKGYSFTAAPGAHAPKVSLTDVKRKIVFCRLSGRMRVAGLADLGSRDEAIDDKRLGQFIGSARQSLPDAANYDHPDSTWAGLRPMSPSSLPIIRKERCGTVLNVGHGALGWTYAMGAADRAAALLLDRQC